MGFDVLVAVDSVLVRLTGWDRVMCWRRNVEFDLSEIAGVEVEKRESLEELIDHRALGFGTHSGSKRPNRRRVGTMLGRAIAGKQFWAVAASQETVRLLVLDLRSGCDFARAVLMVEDPDACEAKIKRALD